MILRTFYLNRMIERRRNKGKDLFTFKLLPKVDVGLEDRLRSVGVRRKRGSK